MIAWVLRQFLQKKQKRSVTSSLPLKGAVHDLEVIYDAVNRKYFDGKLSIKIGWSTGTLGPVKRSRRLGSYCFRTQQIRIHRLLDQEHFPSQFIAFVVYHEMLHHLFPPKKRGSTRRIHHAEFVAEEKKFEEYVEIKAWEKKNRHLFFKRREIQHGRT